MPRWARPRGGRVAAPVACSAVPAPAADSGTDDTGADDAGSDDPGAGAPSPETPVGVDRANAAAALRAAFARLAPQHSDVWNFGAAFTHLGDRYGPYHPGASALSDAMSSTERTARRPGRLGRLRRDGGERAGETEKTELEDAMGHVVEAFRFLSARVTTLESRLAAEDRPVDGMAWLAPARELGPWVEPVTAYLRAATPDGDVVHADCGRGALLDALAEAGMAAQGVEPRGAVALDALERGRAVTIGEVSELLAQRPATSMGGIVLSGVVDRLPLYALVSLLQQCTRVLARGAPLVVVSEGTATRQAPSAEVLPGAPLHAATWHLLLERAGLVRVEPLAATGGYDGRFAVSSAMPS